MAKQNQSQKNELADTDQLASAPLPEIDGGRKTKKTILNSDDWQTPLHLRFRIISIVGLLVTFAWLSIWYQFVEIQLGWNNLLALLPHEITGLVVGAVTPLVMLWTVIAFFERGRQLRWETEALRWHLRQLIYPSDRSRSRVTQITDTLRGNARDLTQASEEAARRTEAVSDLIRERTVELSQVAEDAAPARNEYE